MSAITYKILLFDLIRNVRYSQSNKYVEVAQTQHNWKLYEWTTATKQRKENNTLANSP